MAVVLDGDATLQYVKPISTGDWISAASAAIRRVAAGEDVAAEMTDAYSSYLDNYHQQLTSVSAVDLMPGGGTRIIPASSPTNLPRRPEIAPSQLWTNSDFKQPGNISSVTIAESPDDRYAIFDGWQTLGLVNADGVRVATPDLQLKPQDAAVWLRSSRTTPPMYAASGPLSDRLYLYDSTLKQFGSLPRRDDQWTSPQRIVDAAFQQEM